MRVAAACAAHQPHADAVLSGGLPAPVFPGMAGRRTRNGTGTGTGHGARPARPSLSGDGRGSVGRGGPARAVQERSRRRCRLEAAPALVRASGPCFPSTLSITSPSAPVRRLPVWLHPVRLHPAAVLSASRFPPLPASCPPAASRPLPGTCPLPLPGVSSRAGHPAVEECCTFCDDDHSLPARDMF